MTHTTSDLPAYPMTRTCPFDPPSELARLRAEAPVTEIRQWNGEVAWLLTRYEDQRAVLADPRFSANPRKPGYPHVSAAGAAAAARPRRSASFITMDNPEHDVLRRMLTRDFMIRRIEALRPRIQQIVDDRIDEMLAAGPPTDLVQSFALPVPSLVICELLGVPYTDHDFFQRCSRTIISTRSSTREVFGAADELRAYLFALIKRKCEQPTDDMLSRLGTEQLSTGRLDLAGATDMALLLLVAGHETTANMIALGTLALLEHPDQLAELRAGEDPKVVAGAVEELLRYLTIVHQGRRRVATDDVEIGGRLIRAGEGVILATEAGNRDESAFPHSDDLDIHRDARHHLAFGYGIHQCLGQPLARVELQVVYSTLYRRIPALRAAVPLEQLRFKHEMIVYGVHELPVAW